MTPRNGEILIGAIQDFLTGSYLFTNRDRFFDIVTVRQFLNALLLPNDSMYTTRVPKPAILKVRIFV